MAASITQTYGWACTPITPYELYFLSILATPPSLPRAGWMRQAYSELEPMSFRYVDCINLTAKPIEDYTVCGACGSSSCVCIEGGGGQSSQAASNNGLGVGGTGSAVIKKS